MMRDFLSFITYRLSLNQRGSILILALVFAGIFFIIINSLLGWAGSQYKAIFQRVAFNQSLQISEAGIDYYRWHLAHAPEDFQDGTGESGPYIHDYKDPQGDIIGKFSLEIIPPQECSTIVMIKSTGWLLKYPQIKRSIQIRYGVPSLTRYAFLTNSDVWFGEEEELRGKFHSNGGIRMDGEQNSLGTSAKATYICQAIHGCSEDNCDQPCQWISDVGCECPGIWGEGDGGDVGLWKFPVPNVDFEGITLDLANLKIIAQDGGIYLGSSGAFGYHVRFKIDGSFDLYKVTKLRSAVWGYNGKEWVKESNSIKSETFLQNFSLPSESSGCGPGNLIFIEDARVWVDGKATEKVTLVAAKFPDTSETNAKIIINGNLTYPKPKKALIGLIAQKDILIPLYSPDKLEIDAVLLAQKGHCFRYYYSSDYFPWHLRDKIEVKGSIITNTVWTWNWVNNSGTVISGYKETEGSYDSGLVYSPPPYFPTTGEYEFISWEEIQ